MSLIASPGKAMSAKIRGKLFDGIPFATYNLHPFDGHARDASYAALLDLVESKAGMLVKSKAARRSADREVATATEESGGEIRTTCTWHTPKGTLRSIEAKPPGQPGCIVEHFIKDESDMAKVMSVPPPGKVEFDATKLRQLVARISGKGVAYVDYPDPMYSVAQLFNFEDFSVRIFTEPELMEEMIGCFARRIYAEIEAMARACAGLPVLFYTVGPEVATPPMMPPWIFSRFVTPYEKEIVSILHRHGFSAGIHCHGRVRQVLDEFLEIGIDTLEPIEPPDQGDATLEELLRKVSGRFCLMGYVQDQDFYQAPPGAMRHKVQEIARAVTPTDRYIMMPTCTPFQSPASPQYLAAYAEWINAAAELLP